MNGLNDSNRAPKWWGPWWLWMMAFGAIMAYAVLGLMPHAHADTSELTSAEQSFADHGAGITVCNIFDEYGLTAQTAARAVKAIASVGGFPLVDSALIVNYSVLTYCPRYWSTLAEIGGEARAAGTSQPGTVV